MVSCILDSWIHQISFYILMCVSKSVAGLVARTLSPIRAPCYFWHLLTSVLSMLAWVRRFPHYLLRQFYHVLHISLLKPKHPHVLCNTFSPCLLTLPLPLPPAIYNLWHVITHSSTFFQSSSPHDQTISVCFSLIHPTHYIYPNPLSLSRSAPYKTFYPSV